MRMPASSASLAILMMRSDSVRVTTSSSMRRFAMPLRIACRLAGEIWLSGCAAVAVGRRSVVARGFSPAVLPTLLLGAVALLLALPRLVALRPLLRSAKQ